MHFNGSKRSGVPRHGAASPAAMWIYPGPLFMGARDWDSCVVAWRAAGEGFKSLCPDQYWRGDPEIRYAVFFIDGQAS